MVIVERTRKSLKGDGKMEAFSTMQKMAIWILILVGVFILSDFLINVGLNSTYKDITRQDNHSGVVVYQADATYVNGRIRGLIKETESAKGKYIRIELYSKRNVLVGRGYVELETMQRGETQAFELLFRAKDVASYKIDTVKEKEPGDELEILPREWTKPEIVLATIVTFLIFWG